MSRSSAKWAVVVLAFLVPVGYAAFTQHAWEDYFITLRASRNLAEGNGLVFTVGQRLHTFTSPLGTLLPALFTYLTGPGHEDLALWLFRLVNAAFLAAAARLLWQRFDTLELGAPGRLAFFGLLLADPKLIDFATNGMETALLVFFAVMLWTEIEAPGEPRTSRLTLAFAGLMWTRPDGFVLAGAILLPHLVFRRSAGGWSAFPWRPVLRGALMGGLIYLPWFAWAWWYYGTPVPHTITAKSALSPGFHAMNVLLVPWRVLTAQTFGGNLFIPAYAEFGGWPGALWVVARTLTIVCVFGWLVPRLSPIARRASLAIFIGTFYLTSIILFPWYVPPWSLIAWIAVAFIVDTIAKRHVTPAAQGAVRIVCLLIAIGQVITLGCVAWQMRNQQRYVETGVRRAIGEWLRQHAEPGDTVFLEPLGYIGYFSGLKTYDYPGLSSPEVVAAIRGGARSYPEVIAKLQPRWLVLRPFELVRPEFTTSHVLDGYDLIFVRSAQPDLDQIRVLPGRRWMEYEAQYYVYHRKPDST